MRSGPVDGSFANGSSAVWVHQSLPKPVMEETVAEVMAVAPLPAGNHVAVCPAR